ncbi:MAG: amidohydrolase [Oscillospiraceae bacterium]|nr:amidohydrolase [Oscillospiraceae bacterium]
MLLIKNGHIKPITAPEIPCGCVLIGDDGKILEIGENIAAPAGAAVIDAEGRLVTPGCVEAHCHIGLHGIATREADYNENMNPISPNVQALDGIDPTEEGLRNAIEGGVTCGCVTPGSSNILGGYACAIKFHGIRVDKMVVKNPAAMKGAMGENPKKRHGNINKKPPVTRMGIAAMLREELQKTINYRDAKAAGKNPGYDAKLEAMIPVVNGELPLKMHAHRADDIFTAIRIAREFGLKLTLDHCTEGALIAQELAEEGFPVIVGPSWGTKSKQELDNKSFATAGVLYKAGCKVCITTDAPVMPIEKLPMAAGLCAAEGLPLEAAWQAITINPAETLGIAHRVGSLEVGKDGDLVIWTANPLTTIGGKAYITIIEGKVVYSAE